MLTLPYDEAELQPRFLEVLGELHQLIVDLVRQLQRGLNDECRGMVSNTALALLLESPKLIEKFLLEWTPRGIHNQVGVA